MKEHTIQKLAEILKARTPRHGGRIAAVSTDSRSVEAGDCFFAIPGPNFDGHNFVGRALRKGAVCAVVNRGIKLPGTDEKYLLRVDDTVRALGGLAAHYRTECGFKVIAITGSVGKTTTRHIITHVLSSRFRVFQAPKNFNNEIGLPLTLLTARPDDQFVVAELGANNPGEIAYLSRIAQPDLAVITGVCPAHLEGFGSLDTIIREKLSIAEGLSPQGCLFINGDYENLVEAARHLGLEFSTFGFSDCCDIRPQQADWNHTGSQFAIDSVVIDVPLSGRGNLENAFTAWAVCSRLGFTAEQFAQAVGNLPPIPMRTEIRRFGTVTVIDDSYNANPASMKNALELLSKMAESRKQRSVFICGDMVELGEQSESLHRQLASVMVTAGVRLVVAVGPLAAVAASAARRLADYDLEVETFADADSAADNMHKFVKDYDIVLVKGSRTIALEKVVRKFQELFTGSPLIGADKN
jgi:UDP-N-acetylmuramoyl-tripeptide--D-alanyl-D-alanine ligase